MKSILAHQSQSVHHALPVWSHMGNENWCMTGYHGVSLLSDAYAKGISMDGKKALNAMVQSSNLKYYDGLGSYIEKDMCLLMKMPVRPLLVWNMLTMIGLFIAWH